MPAAPRRPSFKIAIGEDGSLKLQNDNSPTHQELQVININTVSKQATLIQGVYNLISNNKRIITYCIAGVAIYCYLIAPPMAWATDLVYTTKVMVETQKVIAETQKIVVEKQRGLFNFGLQLP